MTATGPPFVFDSCAFISCWLYHHSPDVFPGLWDGISDALGDGRIVAPGQVLTEIELGGDEIRDWCAQRRDCFPAASEEVQAQLPAVLGVAPASWSTDSTHNWADPWIVAMAMAMGGAVATYEGISFSGEPAQNNRRGIMWVCRELGVRCVNPLVVFRELGLAG